VKLTIFLVETTDLLLGAVELISRQMEKEKKGKKGG